MCENYLSFLKNCSSINKQKLNNFLHDLCAEEKTEDSSIECRLQAIFNCITRDFSLTKVRELSKNERSKKDLTNYQYSYGQITFKTIYEIIDRIKRFKQLGKNQVFYDLGSGSGKVLFAASLCFAFDKCKGIEYLQALYQISLELKKKVVSERKEIEEGVCEIIKEDYQMPGIQIFNENFQRMSWNDGTVIFVSSTCYTREVMNKIQTLCEKLQGGTILITLTRSIENYNNSWRLIDKFQGDSSWGPCTVFIHSRDQ